MIAEKRKLTFLCFLFTDWTLLIPQCCDLGLRSLCSMLTLTLVQHADCSL